MPSLSQRAVSVSKTPAEGQSYCSRHAGQELARAVSAAVAGALVGNLLVPGAGGTAVGALEAFIASGSPRHQTTNKRVFVSFDNDARLKHFFVGQAKNKAAPFVIVEGSLKEAAPEPLWKERANSAIMGSGVVVVLLGSDTYRAPGVLAEVAFHSNDTWTSEMKIKPELLRKCS